MHADFLRIDAKHAMTMTIPLHFIGEDVAPGVKEGGLVSHLMTDAEVSWLTNNLCYCIGLGTGSLDLDTYNMIEITSRMT